MIAIIVMIMLFLSFFVVVAYNMMSVNHNLSVSSQMETLDHDLKTITTQLIQEAKPIVSANEYALPYGVNDAANNEHTLPTNLGIPLKNIKGHNYQYCPYGAVGSTYTNIVSQNDGASYGVENTIVDGISYTTYSEQKVISGAPEVQAFIISKFESAVVSCDDVQYDANTASFYLMNAKVSAITKSEVQNYYALQDLSGVIETLTVDSSNSNDLFTLISNDQSNKSYEINLTEDLSLTSSHTIERRKNKSANISINLNGHAISGSNPLEFKNIQLEVFSDSTVSSSAQLTDFNLVDTDAVFDNVLIGGIEATSSDILLEDTEIVSKTNLSFDAINSNVVVRGINGIKSSAPDNINSAFNLLGSKATIENGAVLNIEVDGSKSDHVVALQSSKMNVFGDIKEVSTSNTVLYYPIYIDSSSNMYFNGGTLEVLGYMATLNNEYPVIMVKGLLSSDGRNNSIQATKAGRLYHFIGIKGGELNLAHMEIGANKVLGTGYTLKELSYVSDDKGVKAVSGDSNVIVHGLSGRCWQGDVFRNVDGSTATASAGSNTDKINNLSDFTCQY